MTVLRLRDVDNRDDRGRPFEVMSSVEVVVGYLDGPLRRDLSDPEAHSADVDEAIDQIRSGDIEGAAGILRSFGVSLASVDAV